MALCVRSTSVAGAVRSAATRPAAVRPLTVRRNAVRVAASKTEEAAAFEIGKIATLSAVASSWMFSGNAQAAAELATVAASDNRFGTISLLFLPAIGWVLFNIFQPALNQLQRQNEIREDASGSTSSPARKIKQGKKKRGVAGAVGLGAALSLFAAQQADAATEVAQLAASDNRFGTISLLFVPALAWVGFNMLQPALNQLARQNEIKEEAVGATARVSRKKRGIAGAVGMGAALSLFAAQQADAATEIAQLAASDNRFGTISLLFVPALAWVGFNMLQPALNQLARQNEIKEEAVGATARVSRKKRGIAGAVGMGAALSMFAAQQADAATEIAQLAASDNRFGTISLLFVPALAWVGFNMLQPALNQLARQNEIKEEAVGATARVSRKKRGIAGAVGMGAALSMFAAQQADAATEIAQLAASDNRFGTISLLFVPALAWVGFNMLQPALNQLARQNEIKEEAIGATVKASRRR